MTFIPSGTILSVGQMSQWDKSPSVIKVQVGQMSKWDQCLSGTIVQWDKSQVGHMSVEQLSVGLMPNVTPPSPLPLSWY